MIAAYKEIVYLVVEKNTWKVPDMDKITILEAQSMVH